MKQIPERMCIVCRKHITRDNLIRLVKQGDDIIIDNKCDGRGAYICKNIECITLAGKRSAVQRAFKSPINTDIYDRLRNQGGILE